MSNLPRQLQRQAAEVEAIEKAMADQAAPPPPPETPPPETQEPDGQENPVVPPPPPPPAPPAPETWQQKYQTLEGKYKAEVPRLYQEVKTLKAKLEELAAKPPPPPPAPETPPRAKESKITPKDVENFGDDLLDVIRRAAEEVAATQVDKLNEQIAQLKTENAKLQQNLTGVTETQAASGEEVYLSKLTALVPDWEQINVNPLFLAWLGEVDPLSGLTRQQYLDNAYQARDVKRTAILFNTWISTQAPPPPQVPPKPASRPDVQRQVTPGKSKAASVSPDVSDDKKVWLQDEIAQVYADIRTGRLKPEEAAKLEAQIDLAVSQGRVK